MKTLTITWKYGKTEWTGSDSDIWSAAAVRQVLDQIQDDVRAIFGEYTWSLEGYTGQYEIVARAHEGRWVEGRGRTPREAVRDCHALRTVLAAD